MKLLVFKNTRDLRYFWAHGLGLTDLGRFCRGAVNSMACEVVKFYKDGSESSPVLEVDRRYFAVMGLVQTHLTMEIVCHEAVHAGFAYERRQKRKFWPGQEELDEEGVCYPVGRIATGVNRLLYENGLYPKRKE